MNNNKYTKNNYIKQIIKEENIEKIMIEISLLKKIKHEYEIRLYEIFNLERDKKNKQIIKDIENKLEQLEDYLRNKNIN